LTFFKPQLDCIPLTILLFHRIALVAFVTAAAAAAAAAHACQTGNRKIRAPGSLLKNHFCAKKRKKRGSAQRSVFAIHPCYLSPNDRKRSSPMIAIGRLPIPLSTASRMSTSSTGKTVNYNEREAATTCGGERGLPAGGGETREGGWEEGFEDARRARGKRAKTERGTAHHHGQNPTSYPRRRSCLSVYSSVYSRGRRPQSIDFTPALPPPSTIPLVAPPCPGRLHPRCRSCNISPPTHSRREAATSPLSIPFSLSLSLSFSPDHPNFTRTTGGSDATDQGCV
jgi:hypothetical protein